MSGTSNVSLGSNPPPVFLTESQQRWWTAKPLLEDSVEGPCAETGLVKALDPNNELTPDYTFGEGKKQLVMRYLEWGWDKATLPGVAKLATPCIVLGSILVLIALSAGVTTLTGWEVPGLEVILNNMPLSLAFSLVLIRTGVHLVYQGIVLSKRTLRFRQDTQEANKLYRIENGVKEMREAEQRKRLCEIYWYNRKLSVPMQIQNMMEANALYGKECPDLPAGRLEALQFRQKLQELLPQVLPELPKPASGVVQEIKPQKYVDLDLTAIKSRPSSWDKWYNFWHSKLKAIGVFDMVLGQFMLFTAATAIFCVCFPGVAPSALDLIAHDPYLSVSVSFLMLSSWINCTRTGWRMLTYNKRVDKRGSLEEELQLIDYGIEKRKSYQLYTAIKNHLDAIHAPDRVKADLNLLYVNYCESLPPVEQRLLRVVTRWQKKKTECQSIYDKIHKMGKKWIPSLGKPTVVLGVIITLIGLTCLTMSIVGYVPSSLEFLAKNTPISLLFAGGLIISGFHTIHRGATLGERPVKEEWKKESMGYRRAFIHELFSHGYAHILPAPESRKSPKPRRVVDEIELKPVGNVAKKDEIQSLVAKTPNKTWYRFWIASFKTMTAPDAILGLFLLFCSLAGLAIACGAPAPAHFDFILKDPSYSIFFCISLLGLGVDSLNTSYRMYTYTGRKSQDRANVDVVKKCYEELFAQKPLLSQRV